MPEMSIDSIRVSLVNYQRDEILKEKESDRYLPIWVGPAEADAITVKLQEISVPRPLTHDLLSNIIESMGGKVSYIIVNELQDDTFFANIVLDVDGKIINVDSRPSDAIALAVRTQVNIFVEQQVLDKAGIELDKETGQPLLNDKQDSKESGTPKIREEELRSLSAFRDFIEELNLEDLEKDSP